VASVGGGWGIVHPTKRSKYIGPARSRGVNYRDKAQAEADKRNRAAKPVTRAEAKKLQAMSERFQTRLASVKHLKSLTITGKRWQDSVGSTYYTAVIKINGKVAHRMPYAYGYGDQYLRDSLDWLAEQGVLPDNPRLDDIRASGVKLDYSAKNVKRKKDL
jgi:hypothetical protein